MREILFRGKCKETGKWFEGHYYSVPAPLVCFSEDKQPDEHFIVLENPRAVPDWNMPREMVRVAILPDTVGQYTGLTDKNGNKIFEDDIVKVTDDNGEMNMCSCGIGYVLFYDGSWYIDDEVNDGLYDVSKIYYIEVIGNIHDNPELLE